MIMPNKTADQGFSSNKKYACIFVSSLLASQCLIIAYGETFADPFYFFGNLLGLVLGIFALSSLFSFFVKGKRGALIGSFLSFFFAFLSWYGSQGSSSDNWVGLENFEEGLSDIRQTANRNLNRSGDAGIDVELVQNVFSQFEEDSEALTGDNRRVAEALFVVSNELLEKMKISNELMGKVLTPEVYAAENIDSIETVINRIKSLNDVKQNQEECYLMYKNVDIQLKLSLRERGVIPSVAGKVTDAYMGSANVDLCLIIIQTNIDFAESLLNQYTLLKDEYGRWQVADGAVEFLSDEAANKWNACIRNQLTIEENREDLQRKLYQ